MEHRDAEMAQVTVILRADYGKKTQAAVDQLKGAGLNVTNVDADNGVVEGDIETQKVHALKKLECVETSRIVFDWIADYPPGDPRDQDGKEEPEDAED